MGIVNQLASGIEIGRKNALEKSDKAFILSEQHVYGDNSSQRGVLALADNESYMKWLLSNGYEGKFSLIYIDPPFFTKSRFDATITIVDTKGESHKIKHLAYDDTYERNLEIYISEMTARLILMKRLLKDDGMLWVHLDWHSSHYLKIVLDEVFGEKNFVNEIIWKYKSGGTGKRHFSRKHDTILTYAKTKKYYLSVPTEKSYNRGLKPYSFKGVKEYKDEYGWYTMVNMKDVWTIDMVGRTSGERTGYATQKPVELMKRIIEASSREGDLCGDFFAGSGSFIEACDILNRKWIGCEREELAIRMCKKRLSERGANFDYMEELNDSIPSPEKEYEKSSNLRCAEVELISKEELANGKFFCKYAIKDIKPKVDIKHIREADRELLINLIEEDPISLVDSVLVDNEYNGNFRTESIFTEQFDNICFITRGNVAFKIIDVFGKDYLIEREV